MFTDFCIQFISGFVFCKRREKEMTEREREEGRSEFLITGGSFKYGDNGSKLADGWEDGHTRNAERGG